MATHVSPHSAEGGGFLEGKLLVALPGIPDPRFERSVIFICAHSLENGAMGLIINKPIEGLNFRDLIEKLEIPLRPDTPDFPILYGGPMDTGRGFVLHSNDYGGEDATLTVSADVSLTATLDILRAISEGKGPERAIFALGYAGWAPGQIEDEIRANGWVHCDIDTEILFGTDANVKWATAFGKLGIDISGLTSIAGRA